MAQQIPVYLFTGFLEGGKTRIIQESMEDKRFNSGEKTLMIQCEDGIEELEEPFIDDPENAAHHFTDQITGSVII